MLRRGHEAVYVVGERLNAAAELIATRRSRTPRLSQTAAPSGRT
ncbi:hypothetical protein QSU92_13460 [Microbacterium sp. ET2]|nr:hypothetical protein [Microbacterium sp. ET2 (Ac-2212)]WJL94958.1 hypothetical protein QSU92_13460 [Microbacterium sp. ET2 (Ac-2212)]